MSSSGGGGGAASSGGGGGSRSTGDTRREDTKLLEFYNQITAKLKMAKTLGKEGKEMTPTVPEIVVIGSQSAGKSSLLNKIANTGDVSILMTDEETGTRVPTKLSLLHEDCDAPYMYMFKENQANPYAKRYEGEELKGLNAVFAAMQSELCVDDGFSETAICIEYHGRGVTQPLTLIDLPGFADGRLGAKEIKDIAEKYINSTVEKIPPILVCVMDAGLHEDTDVTLAFLEDLQKAGTFNVNELVVVHNKLDTTGDDHAPHYPRVCKKMVALDKRFPTLRIHHFGTICWGEGFTEELKVQWSAELSERLRDPAMTLGTGCLSTPVGSETKIGFGTDILGEHLSRKLCDAFKQSLKLIVDQLDKSIKGETEAIAKIKPSLGVDEETQEFTKESMKYALEDILEPVFTLFTNIFDLKGIVTTTDSNLRREAKGILKDHQDRAIAVLKGYETQLLDGYKDRSLHDVWSEQDGTGVKDLGNLMVVKQVKIDMDLKEQNEVLTQVHAILHSCMKGVTDLIVYPKLKEMKINGALYDISSGSEYSQLFRHLKPHIRDTFHGVEDWKMITQPKDGRGRSIKGIPFDAHQLVDNNLVFVASVFDKHVFEAAIDDRNEAIAKMNAQYQALMELKGSPGFADVVTPTMETLLADEVHAFCQIVTQDDGQNSKIRMHMPEEYSAPLKTIRDLESFYLECALEIRRLENPSGPVLPTVIKATTPVGRQDSMENAGATVFIDGDRDLGRLVGTKGHAYYLRLSKTGVLTTWATKDEYELGNQPMDEFTLTDHRGVYKLEPDEKGNKLHKFQIVLVPITLRDKAVRKKIYAFKSASDRNLWRKQMEFHMKKLAENSSGRENSEGFTEVIPSEGEFEIYTEDVQEYLRRKGAFDIDGPNETFDDLPVSTSGDFYTWLQAQCSMDPLPTYHALRENAKGRWLTDTAVDLETDGVVDDGTVGADKLERLRLWKEQFEALAAGRKTKDEVFDDEHKAYLDATQAPLNTMDAHRRIAWGMKRDYSNAITAFSAKLTKTVEHLFKFVAEKLMSNDPISQNIFKTKFRNEKVDVLREMFSQSGAEGARLRQEAVARKTLYEEAQDLCKEARTSL